MRILVTGGTGLIGSYLVPKLQEHAQVVAYTRNVAKAELVLTYHVQFVSDLDKYDNLDQYDAVINLAGEPIVDKRWTDKQKREIENSRWGITRKIVDLINAGSQPPAVFISGSAIGYYGRQHDQLIDESFNKPYDEFSHQLCRKWEEIALEASSVNTRVCVLRTGIVLSRKGGALGKMLPPFQMGLGGRIGNGQQYMSWIHLEDMLNGIFHLLTNEKCEGIFNFTAPNPVTNQVFSKKLADAINRPCIFPMPSWVLKLLMGESADLLLYGQRVVPKKLLESGFSFKHPTLDDALADLNLP